MITFSACYSCFDYAAITCIHINEESKDNLGEKTGNFSRRSACKIGICSQISRQTKHINSKVNHSLYNSGQARWFQGAEATRFQDNRHIKVVRLLALHTGRLYPPTKYSWSLFLLQAEAIPGSYCDRKDYVSEKFRQHRQSNPRPSGL